VTAGSSAPAASSAFLVGSSSGHPRLRARPLLRARPVAGSFDDAFDAELAGELATSDPVENPAACWCRPRRSRPASRRPCRLSQPWPATPSLLTRFFGPTFRTPTRIRPHCGHRPTCLARVGGHWRLVCVGSRDGAADLSCVSPSSSTSCSRHPDAFVAGHLTIRRPCRRRLQRVTAKIHRVLLRLPARHAVFVRPVGDVPDAAGTRESDVDSERLVILEELRLTTIHPNDVAHRMFAGTQLSPTPTRSRRRPCDRGPRWQRSTPPIARVLRVALPRPDRMGRHLAGRDAHDEPSNWWRMRSSTSSRLATSAQLSAPASIAPTIRWPRHRADPHRDGGRALQRGDEDREARDVVNHVFGGGLSTAGRGDPRATRPCYPPVYSWCRRI